MACAKPKMTGEALVVLMDRFAVSVLKQAEVAKELPDKIAAGELVAQWIWVKHLLGYGEDQELPSLGDLRAGVRNRSAGAELKAGLTAPLRTPGAPPMGVQRPGPVVPPTPQRPMAGPGPQAAVLPGVGGGFDWRQVLQAVKANLGASRLIQHALAHLPKCKP